MIKTFILGALIFVAVPPTLTLKSLEIIGENGKKTVRFATPRHWPTEEPIEASSIRQVGPEGEGEITVLVATHPSQLGELLTRLKEQHPGAQPSPPRAMKVHGIDPEKGERATRFIITGKEVGEMVMIERGGAIVLFASIMAPSAWKDLEKMMARCYPTVDVTSEASR